MTEAEKAQLFAIRNIVDAMLMGSAAPDPAPCIHPEREEAPDSTWGNRRERCAVCKAPLGE